MVGSTLPNSLNPVNQTAECGVDKEIVASSSVQVQPRLQRNALNLFEILSSNHAVLAPAEGIFCRHRCAGLTHLGLFRARSTRPVELLWLDFSWHSCCERGLGSVRNGSSTTGDKDAWEFRC